MRVPPEDRPPESVDDPDHGVQGIEQTPFFRYDVAGEPHGRNIQAELDDEGDDVPKVPVSDIERGEPQAEAEGRRECQQQKQGKAEHPPAGDESVPCHEEAKDDEGDEKIHYAYDHGACGDNDAREINLGQHAGVADQGSACL